MHMSLYVLPHITAWTQGQPLLPALSNSGRFLIIHLNKNDAHVGLAYIKMRERRIQKFVLCLSLSLSIEVGNGKGQLKRLLSFQLLLYFRVHRSKICICDMIKGNESDVGNINFELQAKKVINSYVLHCF